MSKFEIQYREYRLWFDGGRTLYYGENATDFIFLPDWILSLHHFKDAIYIQTDNRGYLFSGSGPDDFQVQELTIEDSRRIWEWLRD